MDLGSIHSLSVELLLESKTETGLPDGQAFSYAGELTELVLSLFSPLGTRRVPADDASHTGTGQRSTTWRSTAL